MERWLSGWKRLPAKELQEVTFVEGSNPSLSVLLVRQEGNTSDRKPVILHKIKFWIWQRWAYIDISKMKMLWRLLWRKYFLAFCNPNICSNFVEICCDGLINKSGCTSSSWLEKYFLPIWFLLCIKWVGLFYDLATLIIILFLF